MGMVGKWFGFGRNDRYDQGIRAYESGMYEMAIDALSQVQKNTNDPAVVRLAKFYIAESFAQLGQTALRAGQFASAASNLAAALEVNPTFPDLHFSLAMACRGLGDVRGAEYAIERALDFNAKYAAAVLFQGIILYENGKPEEGLARVAVAIELEPALAGERYQFALECHKSGDSKRCLANLEALSSNDSGDANAHARIADTFGRQGLWLEAAQEYGRALEIAPRFADIRFRYGQALLELDHIEPAIEQFGLALQINPKYADAWAGQGIALRRAGRDDESQTSFVQALMLDPQHIVALQEKRAS